MVTKPQGVVLARARMPLYLLGLARSQGARGRVGRCWVLSGLIAVLSSFFIGFYLSPGFIWLWWALVGFGGGAPKTPRFLLGFVFLQEKSTPHTTKRTSQYQKGNSTTPFFLYT